MIVSHKYKFIFIKTAKTAGTSIEIALSKFCGDDDIISRLEPREEEVRAKLGYRGPQNYFAPKSRYSVGDWKRYLLKGVQSSFRKHNSAKQVRNYVGKKVWNSYFKFCVERNPWDRFISLYYYINNIHPTKSPPSISEFLETEWADFLSHRGYYLYTINGHVAMDKVCLYENLEEDLEEVRLRIGLPEKLMLPKANAFSRKDRRSYLDVLKKDQAEKIKEIAHKEIDLFGYKFE